MKQIQYILVLALSLGLFSCSEDNLRSESIFDSEGTTTNDFDRWLVDNYTTPYNIRFNYRYQDIEVDSRYNVLPADYDKSVATAKLVKHLWLDAYTDATKDVDPDFIHTYCPRLIQLIGSAAWEDNGSYMIGQAEGGLKVSLFDVNSLNLTNLNVNTINDKWLHTMHHEYGHILLDAKPYDKDFESVTKDTYTATGWTTYSTTDARRLGYISTYSMSKPEEDFVELLAVYLTHDQAGWEALLDRAKQTRISSSYYNSYLNGSRTMPANASLTTETITDDQGNETVYYYLYYGGDQLILEKFAYVTTYFEQTWHFSLSDLRNIILTRSASVDTLDLTSL